MSPSTPTLNPVLGPETDIQLRSEPQTHLGLRPDLQHHTVHRRPIMSTETRKKFINYPLPVPGPAFPYYNDRKSNPPLRGWVLVAAAWAMECFWFVRSFIWKNAGFGSVRKIRKHIEDAEPRYDPTVLPVPTDEAKDPAVLHRESAVQAKPHPSKYYTVNDYHEMYLSGVVTPLAVARVILSLVRRDTNPPGEHSLAWFDTKVEQVLAAAEASTKRYKEGCSLGPLDGVPTAVKDEYEIDGYRTCLGSRNDYTTKAEPGQSITSWCVRKLEDAGAVVMGKLSMHEFGLGEPGIMMKRMGRRTLTIDEIPPETTQSTERRGILTTAATTLAEAPRGPDMQSRPAWSP
ncbi:amidase [Colletotrichum graminicola]|nr:amidase [Colletotrichum graminicola]